MKSTSQKAEGKHPRPTYLREIEIRYRKHRVSDDAPIGKPIRGIKQILELFSDLQNETKEKLIAISLDNNGKIICYEVVAIGSVSTIYMRPVEAVRASILVNAIGVVVVHNHPSGDPEPSSTDKSFTQKLKRSCDDLGIILHDHVIIGDDDYYSFAEEEQL